MPDPAPASRADLVVTFAPNLAEIRGHRLRSGPVVPIDWNRDGMDSPAVFRPVNSTFYFRFTNDDGGRDFDSS